MSESLLFGELLDHVRKMIDERLARFRADLSRSTGVVPPGQLPTDGNTGSGYSPAAHASTHADGGSDPLTPAAIGAVADDDVRLSDARTPTGGAGGVLSGTYPNPGFAVNMAEQSELDAHTSLTTSAHGGIVASSDTRLTDARTPTAHATSHQHGGSDEIATTTPAANAIPKANGSGWLDSWLSTAIARLTDLTWSNISSKPSTFAPSTHASSHQHGGGDEVATATPAANAIPKAGGAGTIADGWLSALIARVADIVTHAAVVTGVHGLINSGSYTLTIPASGTAALRASAATAGRVGFWSDAQSLSHDANLFWDDANDRLGIGLAVPTTLLHIHSTSVPTMLRFSSFAPGMEFQDHEVNASRIMLGAFGLGTAAGHYSAGQGDMNFVTASWSSSNSSAINFSTPNNDSGTYTRRLIVTRAGVILIGKTSGLTGAGDLDVAGVIAGDKHIRLTEITAPAAPSANQVVIYAEDNGSGKTRLMARFSSGAAQQIAIQP